MNISRAPHQSTFEMKRKDRLTKLFLPRFEISFQSLPQLQEFDSPHHRNELISPHHRNELVSHKVPLITSVLIN